MERKGIYKSNKFAQRMCEVFNQEKGLLADKALCLGASGDGTIFIGTENGVNYRKKNGEFGAFSCGAVSVLAQGKDGVVYFASGKTVYICEKGKIRELQTLEEEVKGITYATETFLITADNIYRLEDGKFNFFYDNELKAEGVSSAPGRLMANCDTALTVFVGKRKHWMCIFPEHSSMPYFHINSITFDKNTGFLWLATDKGAYIYDNNNAWFGPDELSSLPSEEIYKIAFADDGRIAFASNAGLILVKNGVRKYLPATRWVLDEKVNDVIFSGNDIWTATDSGVTRIYEEEMTLAEKAQKVFEYTEKYYIREPGFVTGVNGIVGRDVSTGKPRNTDNDGLWSHCYLGGLSYCYAVTKDEKVLEAARRIMKACGILTKITGKKGFTARALRFEGDEGYGKNLDMQIDGGEWHKAPDGSCEWLGETSSDEMTGHFFGFSLYYDFCANEEEKKYIREIICDIVDHIIEHKYRLHDIDDKPTTWACWDPDELNGKSMWLWEKCINSLEILTFLNVAYHMSGDEKYRKEFLKLAIDEHYLLNAAQPKKDDARVCHIDDNLGFLCNTTFLRLEKDPAIRAYILMGLRQHWEYERNERNPFFNLAYNAFTDDVCDIEYAVKHLREIPLDFIQIPMLNNNRKDLEFDMGQEKWGGSEQLKVALDIDQRVVTNYDTNPYRVNNGKGTTACNTASFLIPYWFGRYYGLIEE
ncbi:MAG: hypothetical protein J6V78_01095 [Clostridia bacterium]|nr:hypothetical protein [Clostridia bacterium]